MRTERYHNKPRRKGLIDMTKTDHKEEEHQHSASDT